MAIVYVVLLHVALIFTVLIYTHERHVLNQSQIKNVATGVILSKCLKDEPSSPCGAVKIITPVWYNSEVPYWEIDYYIAGDKGSIFLDRFGNKAFNP
jgi:hypothetical protein